MYYVLCKRKTRFISSLSYMRNRKMLSDFNVFSKYFYYCPKQLFHALDPQSLKIFQDLFFFLKQKKNIEISQISEHFVYLRVWKMLKTEFLF